MTWAIARNKTKNRVVLQSADGDKVTLQPHGKLKVDAKFLWQVPDEVKILETHPDVEQ